MSAFRNPKIVTDGLVFCIDAKNYKSYTSSSLDIRDLASQHTASFIDGTPTFDGESFQIDGANNYAVVCRESIPDLNFTSGDYSIEVWCKFSTLASWHYIPFSIWNTGAAPGTNEWLIGSNSSKMQFVVADASNTNRTILGSDTELNKWYQLVGIRKDTTIYLYLNGEQDGTPVTDAALSGSADTDTPLYIGAFRNNATLPEASPGTVFSGSMATIKIYKKALSVDEIKQNYNALCSRFEV